MCESLGRATQRELWPSVGELTTEPIKFHPAEDSVSLSLEMAYTAGNWQKEDATQPYITISLDYMDAFKRH